MREWESATWAAGQTEAEVIRRVGKKIARRARKLTRSDDLILVLAGKGHNGDDARAAKEFLENRRVEIIDATDPEAALSEFQSRAGVASGQQESGSAGILPAGREGIETRRQDAGAPALIIDGLFGIGLNRPLDDG